MLKGGSAEDSVYANYIYRKDDPLGSAMRRAQGASVTGREIPTRDLPNWTNELIKGKRPRKCGRSTIFM